MLFLIIASLAITSASSYLYNDFKYAKDFPGAPKYPSNCCQLEWQNISLQDSMPPNAVLGGIVGNEKFYISRSAYPTTAFKRDVKYTIPNWMEYSEHPTHPFPILINPNNCKIGWQAMTETYQESPREITADGRFFPTLGRSKYGDFVRVGGVPGLTHPKDSSFNKVVYPGFLASCFKSGTSQFVAAPQHPYRELMYVEC